MWLRETLEAMIDHPWATFFLFLMITGIINSIANIFRG
jgi:hypothetical protein